MFSIFEIRIFKLLFNVFIIINILKLINKFINNLLTRFYFFFKIFRLIFFFNILSIVPYRLSVTSLTSNLILSFILWFSLFFYYMLLKPSQNIGHFLPIRAPAAIIIALVLIESVSVLIRPLSLRVRLMSNITSRHLVIHLISEARRLVRFFLIFLVIFEFFVCFIQSYIFYLLLNIYLDEIIY